MKASAAHYLCRRLTYKPGLVIGCTLSDTHCNQASITIGLNIPDTTGGPNHPAVTDGMFRATWRGRSFDLARIRTTEEFMLQVRASIKAFEDHELLENLRYRGELVWLPHRPGQRRALTEPDDALYFERRKQTNV